MIRASWDRLSSPPPSRMDNAILPQGSAECYKKGGSLSQGFSLALPPAAWLASNGRGAPARLGKKLCRYPWRAGRASPAYPSGDSLPCIGPATSAIHRAAEKGCSRELKGIETYLEAPPLWYPVSPAPGKALGRSRRHLPLQPPSPSGGPHKHSL